MAKRLQYKNGDVVEVGSDEFAAKLDEDDDFEIVGNIDLRDERLKP